MHHASRDHGHAAGPQGVNFLAEGGRRGWPIILSGLKTLLETGRPLPQFELSDMPTEIRQ